MGTMKFTNFWIEQRVNDIVLTFDKAELEYEDEDDAPPCEVDKTVINLIENGEKFSEQ